jgi:hypothetical protein
MFLAGWPSLVGATETQPGLFCLFLLFLVAPRVSPLLATLASIFASILTAFASILTALHSGGLRVGFRRG